MSDYANSDVLVTTDWVKAHLDDPNVKAILVNIFGGITRGDEVARGIVSALNEVGTKLPMVVRLVGTNAEEGREILRQANLIAATTMDEAGGGKMCNANGQTGERQTDRDP